MRLSFSSFKKRNEEREAGKRKEIEFSLQGFLYKKVDIRYNTHYLKNILETRQGVCEGSFAHASNLGNPERHNYGKTIL